MTENNLSVTRIRPGAKAFIVHEGKILVVTERLQNGLGTILSDLPGGGIELGETAAEALKREVFEEVGLKVEIIKPVGSWDFFVDGVNEKVHIVCLAYQCSVSGSPEIDVTKNPAAEDIFETRWMTKEEIIAENIFLDDMIKSLENIEFKDSHPKTT